MINLFILIDALGWDYIKDRPFLDGIAVNRRPVKSVLGFSSGVIPSILTGKYPQEHRHWSLYHYSPKTSPFRWTKALHWLPDKILNSRLSRKIIEEISKRIMGYTGYFETYIIPVRDLYMFDMSERKNIYAPKGVEGFDNIFDVYEKNNINYRSFSYPLKDKDILLKARESLKKAEADYYFIYLCEFDALLHSSCKDDIKVKEAIDYYENEIKALYEKARERSKDIRFYVFSDHGMAKVRDSIDIKPQIDALGFNVPKDYAVFYDSTMARFWFFNDDARNRIKDFLKEQAYGRILSRDELKKYGAWFDDNRYGEVIFLMNTGIVIKPSFMGSKVPDGMHGYDVDDKSMDAMLVSNCEIDKGISDIKDVFGVMTKNLGFKDLDSSPSAQNDKELARNDKRCHPERSEGSGL